MLRFTKDVASVQVPKNPDAKPDIITCNSVLNACAFTLRLPFVNAASYECRGANLGRFPVVDTPPLVDPPCYLRQHPSSIEKHMLPAKDADGIDDNGQNTNWRRLPFGIAARSVVASVLVVTNLALVLPWDRLRRYNSNLECGW
jgi:hypothetical protein